MRSFIRSLFSLRGTSETESFLFFGRHMPTKAKRYCKLCNKIATKGAYCDEHAPSYAPATDREAYRDWYWLPIWKRMRKRHLMREPFCRECLKNGVYVKATQVDHIVPHRGDWDLFTNEDNLQTLCEVHHTRKTMRERAERSKG